MRVDESAWESMIVTRVRGKTYSLRVRESFKKTINRLLCTVSVERMNFVNSFVVLFN